MSPARTATPTPPTPPTPPAAGPRRLTLLYQVFLARQASRRFMELALLPEGPEGLDGEAYAIYSYLYANGPRSLTQAARDLGMPLSTLASTFAPHLEAGHIIRRPNPADGRSRLLELSPGGRARLEAAMPAFTAAYRKILAELAARAVDPEPIYDALDQLTRAIRATNAELVAGAEPRLPDQQPPGPIRSENLQRTMSGQ